MRLSTPQRAKIAGLIGQLALEIDELPDPAPAPVPPPAAFTLKASRLEALGWSVAEFKALMTMPEAEFQEFLSARDRDNFADDPAPELPLEMPAQSLSSITPSRADSGLAKFSQNVNELTQTLDAAE